MINEFKILRKDGWRINPDDVHVTKLLEQILENDGHCPSHPHNRVGHDQCPCSAYLQLDTCYCGLYVKEKNKNNNSEHKPIQNFSSYGGC